MNSKKGWKRLGVVLNNRYVKITLFFEAVILIGIICSFFVPRKTINLLSTDFSTIDEKGSTCSKQVELQPGIYQVQLLYETDSNLTNLCEVTAQRVSYDGMLCNQIPLYSGKTTTAFHVYVLEKTSTFQITTSFGGTGSLSVKGANIYQTNLMNRIALAVAALTFLVVNCIACFVLYDKKWGIPVEKKQILFGLLGIIILSNIGLLSNSIINGADMGYHMHRIEGIVNALRAGQFPVRMEPSWLEGYGYANAIFYCETFLYFPAVLRILGFTVQTSYKAYLIMTNAATVLVTYACIKKIFNNSYVGLWGSMLYTLSLYRLSSIYQKATLGQFTAMIFYPILLLAFYNLFTMNRKEKQYKNNWILLVIGYSGVIQSHILSCEMIAGLTILLVLVCIKLIFRKETILEMLKGMFGTILLNAWFLVPLFDYTLSGSYMVTNDARINNLIQKQGGDVINLFRFWGGIKDSTGNIEIPISIGAPITFCCVVFIFLCLSNNKAYEKKDLIIKKSGTIALGLGLWILFMASKYFPWDILQKTNSKLNILATSLQLPTRLIVLASICLCFVSCAAMMILIKYYKKIVSGAFTVIILLITIISTMFFFDSLSSGSTTRIFDPETMGTYIGGAEYLPAGTDMTLLTGRIPITSDNSLKYSEYSKKYLNIEMYCSNGGVQAGYVDLPLLFYKGYAAKDTQGQKLSTIPGENNCVRVVIPAGYEGNISVDYVSPWYWRLSEGISIGMFLLLIIAYYRNRKVCIAADGELQ